MRLTFPAYLAAMLAVLGGGIGAAWIYTYNFRMAYLPSGYGYVAAKAEMLRRCDLGQVMFAGDSRIESGLIPALLPIESRNISVPIGSPIEISVMVKRTLACGTRPKQVVVSITPQHFGPVFGFFWHGILGYRFVSLADLREVEATARRVGDVETLGHSDDPAELPKTIRDYVYAIGFPSIHAASLVRARLFMRYDENLETYRTALATRGYFDRPVGAGNYEAVLETFVPTPLQDALFDQALRELTGAGIYVGLMIMPERPMAGPTAYYDQFRNYLERKANAVPGVRIINSLPPQWPASSFADGSHLTNAGARLFTKTLSSCVANGMIRSACDLSYDPSRAVTPSP